MRIDSWWTGTRSQLLASMAREHNLAPGLTDEEIEEVFQELGIKVPEQMPAGYVWDGVEY